jgi:hypothetical protein
VVAVALPAVTVTPESTAPVESVTMPPTDACDPVVASVDAPEEDPEVTPDEEPDDEDDASGGDDDVVIVHAPAASNTANKAVVPQRAVAKVPLRIPISCRRWTTDRCDVNASP